MIFAIKVKSFLFNGENEKQAYLKGCKQLAKFTASKKYRNLFFKIERIASQENVFKFSLYTGIDANEAQKEFCSVCKEIHRSFFLVEDANCARCNLKAYLRRINEKGVISKSYYRKEVERRT